MVATDSGIFIPFEPHLVQNLIKTNFKYIILIVLACKVSLPKKDLVGLVSKNTIQLDIQLFRLSTTKTLPTQPWTKQSILKF